MTCLILCPVTATGCFMFGFNNNNMLNFFFRDMEIPDTVKNNVRLVLLSKPTGIFLDDFDYNYQGLVNDRCNYRVYGYKTLEDFLINLPEFCR